MKELSGQGGHGPPLPMAAYAYVWRLHVCDATVKSLFVTKSLKKPKPNAMHESKPLILEQPQVLYNNIFFITAGLHVISSVANIVTMIQ